MDLFGVQLDSGSFAKGAFATSGGEKGRAETGRIEAGRSCPRNEAAGLLTLAVFRDCSFSFAGGKSLRCLVLALEKTPTQTAFNTRTHETNPAFHDCSPAPCCRHPFSRYCRRGCQPSRQEWAATKSGF